MVIWLQTLDELICPSAPQSHHPNALSIISYIKLYKRSSPLLSNHQISHFTLNWCWAVICNIVNWDLSGWYNCGGYSNRCTKILNGCLITRQDEGPRTNSCADEIVQIKINGSADKHEDGHFHSLSFLSALYILEGHFFHFHFTSLHNGNTDILFISENVTQHLHSKTPHEVTVLWLDSDHVVTILSPTSGTGGRLQNCLSVPPWFLHSDCV